MMKSTPEHHEAIRQRIIEQAVNAFHQEGVKCVTMDSIAHALSMSKRTLYQMFSDKEELLLACIRWHDEQHEEELSRMLDKQDNVLEFILTIFAKRLEEMQQIKHTFFMEILKYPKVMAYFGEKQQLQEKDAVEFLNRGIEQGYFRRDVNFRIVYNQLTEGINTMLRNKVLQSYSQRELFCNTVLIYLRGCATLRGIELIDKFMGEAEAE